MRRRGQGLSYINRGSYYIWWLISNYQLYKGGSESRCSLLSFMQIKKTTPREENIFPVSLSFSFSFVFNMPHFQNPLRLLLITYTINTLKSAKCQVGYCLRFIFLVQCTAWEMPVGGKIKICNDKIIDIVDSREAGIAAQTGAPSTLAQDPSFHTFCFFLCSPTIPITHATPQHTHNLLHTGFLNNATFITLKLFFR